MTEETKTRPRIGVREHLTQMAAAIWAGYSARPEVLAPVERPKPERRPKGAQPVDFHLVPAHQFAIDARLRNWGIWCNSRTGAASSSPMFRLGSAPKAARAQYNMPIGESVDRSDAIVMARAVTALPEAHASALNWHYVKPVSPRRAAEALGVSFEGLAGLVIDARQMLMNRLE